MHLVFIKFLKSSYIFKKAHSTSINIDGVMLRTI